jgi:hypothetical protein
MVFVGFLTEKALDESREVYIRTEKPVILPVVTSARAPEQAPGIYHRMVASDDRQAASLAEFARDELKVKSVLIVPRRIGLWEPDHGGVSKSFGDRRKHFRGRRIISRNPDDLAKLADRVAGRSAGRGVFGNVRSQSGQCSPGSFRQGNENRFSGNQCFRARMIRFRSWKGCLKNSIWLCP